MGAIAYTPERRDLAFKIWREEGQNASSTIRRLKSEHQWPLSRSTLLKWIERYNWIQRSVQITIEEQTVKDSKLSGSDKVLADLLRLKKQLGRYLESIEKPDDNGRIQKPDSATVSAYTRLCDSIAKLHGDNGVRRRVAMEVLTELVVFTKDRYPQHAQAVSEVIQPFAVELSVIWSDDDA